MGETTGITVLRIFCAVHYLLSRGATNQTGSRGTSFDAGPLSHTSTNRPAPLSRLEEAIRIVCIGATGVTTQAMDRWRSPTEEGESLARPF